ncbi:MAG: hypothetical protein K6E29_03830 [Cyanobacteria bacterium RUI128]|nr:hypothetical protein [Cyanobacteria bacterium RUI128]
MQEVSASAPKKTYVAPKMEVVPVLVFTPANPKGNSLNNEIDRVSQNKFERTPDADGFEYEKNEANLLGNAQMKALKVPTKGEIVTGIIVAKEIFNVLNDAVIAGRNLWETLADWIGSNDKLSDSEKVQAMEIGNLMAKQMSVKEAA